MVVLSCFVFVGYQLYFLNLHGFSRVLEVMEISFAVDEANFPPLLSSVTQEALT